MSEEMEDLVRQYTEGLPDRVKEIESLWNMLQETWDIETFSDFHLKVHDLCASSELYGYRNISNIANQMQMCLLLLSRESNMVGDIQKQEVDDLLNQLKEAISSIKVVDMA